MQLHSESLNLYFLFRKVRKRLSEVTAGYWADLEIYSALNQGQQHIARKSKCLQKTVTVTTIESTGEYDLKDNGFADIISISEDGVYFYQNGSVYMPLTYKTKKQLNMEFPGWQGVADSIPQYYYYDKATKTIGLYPKPNAVNVGDYLFVSGSHRPAILHAGTAAAGGATSITLAAGSSTAPYPSVTDDYYNGLYIEINSGTGAGQKAEITDYVGATKVCTAVFPTSLSTDSVYGMVPQIPEEAHDLMFLFAMKEALKKGGSRIVLANDYKAQYYNELGLFIGEIIEEDDECLIKDTYR